MSETVNIDALISTIGLIVFFEISIKITTVALPAFLLSVSVCDAVHVMSFFYSHYQKGYNKRDSIIFAMEHSGLAIVLTSLTTIASLLSFPFAELTSIAELSIFGTVGVLLALIYTIILLPSLIAIIPVKRKDTKKENTKSKLMDNILLGFANIPIKYPKTVLFISIIILPEFQLLWQDQFLKQFTAWQKAIWWRLL